MGKTTRKGETVSHDTKAFDRVRKTWKDIGNIIISRCSFPSPISWTIKIVREGDQFIMDYDVYVIVKRVE